MRFDLKKAALILALCLICGILIYGMFALPSFTADSNARHTDEVVRILRKAAVQCYALEGEYPQNLEYLQQKYGVILDEDRFLYYYDTGGVTNMMPDIQVFLKD